MCALSVPAIALTRGTNGEEVLIPQLGLGTYKIPDDEAECAVRDALAVGYRHIDTAQMYGNEAGVGRAIAACGLPRRDLFVTSKLDNPNHRRDDALRSLDATMGALGLEVLDLFLVHWPLATSTGIDLVDTWRTMIEILHSGRVRAIGVSNFQPDHLRRIVEATGVVPAVNQIESHPRFPNTGLIAYDAERGIATEAWSPLGRDSNLLAEAVIVDVAAAHAITAAQAVLAWHVARGVTPIPKSASPHRQAENLASQAVLLSPAEVGAITSLGRPDGRLAGQDPH